MTDQPDVVTPLGSHHFDASDRCVNCGYTLQSREGKRPCAFEYLQNDRKAKPDVAGPVITEAIKKGAALFRRCFVPVTYESEPNDSIERAMLKKIYNVAALAKHRGDGVTADELRTIQRAAFAALDGPDPDYGF